MFSEDVTFHQSAEACTRATRCCVVVNYGDELGAINEWLAEDHVVIDCWRSLSLDKGTVLSLGVGQEA